ncbi:MAG: hypothetical protein M1819_002406 [Sarea resinae]|nr:MAG: hypothetical protein M1819_002406 [Sarea resinae]
MHPTDNGLNNTHLIEVPLSASLYNGLPHIDSMRDAAAKNVEAHAQLLGLIASHGLAQHFSVHLIHKHFDIPHGRVMVYEIVRGHNHPEFVLSSPRKPADCPDMRGLYFKASSSGEMAAYEYTTVPGEDLSAHADFVAKFAQATLDLGVQHIFALTATQLHQEVLTEFEMPDVLSTVLVENPAWLPQDLQDWQSTATDWLATPEYAPYADGPRPNAPGIIALKCVGASGIVYALDAKRVFKMHLPHDWGRKSMDIETRIYARLGLHPRIVKSLGSNEKGIMLERLECQLRKRNQDCNGAVSTHLILQWAIQVAEGLQYMHENAVLQIDIGCHNLLVDPHDDVKFCDFAGSSIDGQEAMVAYDARTRYPHDDEVSIRSEIFALGSVLYEISTAQRPHHDKASGDKVQGLFRAGIFPRAERLLLKDHIDKCWAAVYKSVAEVITDLECIRQAALEEGNLISGIQSQPSSSQLMNPLPHLPTAFTICAAVQVLKLVYALTSLLGRQPD